MATLWVTRYLLIVVTDPSILNDITNGSNPNCGKPISDILVHVRYIEIDRMLAGSQGFQTSTGWDPVTGLGTPNYPKMLEYFMSLP